VARADGEEAELGHFPAQHEILGDQTSQKREARDAVG